jgi:serine/threonine protein kinase
MRLFDDEGHCSHNGKTANRRLGYTDGIDSGHSDGIHGNSRLFLVQLNMPDWKNCEGQLLDGKYLLERLVSGDEACALFRIGFGSTAVKIRRADAAQAASLVQRWNRVKLLRHSHLLQLDAAGVWVMAGEPVAYLVMQQAEENLAEILRDRSLTTDETRDMLLQVSSALDYLHSQGMKHGDVNASNIMAIGDTVKLSSESIVAGDAAADMRALGFTLIHALTQREETLAHDDVDPTVDLPAPFDEIVKGCLNPQSSISMDCEGDCRPAAIV